MFAVSSSLLRFTTCVTDRLNTLTSLVGNHSFIVLLFDKSGKCCVENG